MDVQSGGGVPGEAVYGQHGVVAVDVQGRGGVPGEAGMNKKVL